MESSLIKEIGSWMVGLPPLAVFIIIVLLIGLVFFGKTLNKKLSGFDLSRITIFSRNNDHRIPSLIDHDIFNTIERIRSTIKHTTFDTHSKYDKTKSLMFHDFMEFKLDVVQEMFTEYITTLPKDVSFNALKNGLFILSGDIVEEYLKRTEEHFLRKGVSPEDTNYVLMLFEQWRAETLESVGYRINSVFASTLHVGKFEKLLGSLEAFSIAIDLIPKDGIAAFAEMNGRFKDLKY